MNTVYKIFNSKTQLFSKGAVLREWCKTDEKFYVKFDKKGKEWHSERLIKSHLLKCIQCGISSNDWEILEVTYTPTKPMNEWIDEKMLLKILKS